MGQCISSVSMCQYNRPRYNNQRLKQATFDSVDVFEPPSGKCKVLDAYDVDTMRVALPMPDGTLAKFTIRLLHVDGPERKPSKSSTLHDLEKQAAMRCRAKVLTMVTNTITSLDFTEASAKDECGKSTKILRMDGKMFDKYGRILATLHTTGKNGFCINQRLIDEGWVRSYEGGTRKPWTKKELNNILKK